jgi:hypothetical protein
MRTERFDNVPASVLADFSARMVRVTLDPPGLGRVELVLGPESAEVFAYRLNEAAKALQATP